MYARSNLCWTSPHPNLQLDVQTNLARSCITRNVRRAVTKRLQLQVCITKGLSHGRAASVMSMQYLAIVLSQVAGMALFGEYTSVAGIIGMCLVVGSMVVYVCWESARKARAA